MPWHIRTYILASPILCVCICSTTVATVHHHSYVYFVDCDCMYTAFIGGVATYVDYTHNRSMCAYLVQLCIVSYCLQAVR